MAREGALLAGGARAILLQIAHPAVGRGVAEHSDFAARPLDRLRTTLTYVYCVTFGTPEEINAVAAAVTAAHRKVAGAGYRASDPELQLWVAATLYDTAVLVYEELFGRLDSGLAEKVYAQYAVLGTALQVPDGMWPADREAFGVYWKRMIDTLEVSDDARRVALELLSAELAPWPLEADDVAQPVPHGRLAPRTDPRPVRPCLGRRRPAPLRRPQAVREPALPPAARSSPGSPQDLVPP